MNYYNEFDHKAAAWLRELIRAGLIPDGHVDTRSIVDVQPSDLTSYTQCHFFAGIGGWSLALQLAGWPADRPVWTGSCPCQPFSSAGKQLGAADERHLWPAFFSLIRQCRPESVFGEQVANAVGHGWLDGISADLEGENYSCGAAVLGAHSVGAPHIRQRLYWVAITGHMRRGHRAFTGRQKLNEAPGLGEKSFGLDNSELTRLERFSQPRGFGQGDGRGEGVSESAEAGGEIYHTMANSDNWRLSQFTKLNGKQEDHSANRHSQGRHIDGCCDFGGLAQPSSRGLQDEDQQHGDGGQKAGLGQADQFGIGSAWSAAAHVECRDGKIRRIPVEPGLFPLAHGVPGRVGLLRGSGNAIVPQVAAAFIEAACVNP